MCFSLIGVTLKPVCVDSSQRSGRDVRSEGRGGGDKGVEMEVGERGG